MDVSRPFILRPVATTLVYLGLVLLGALGLHVLPVSALPAIDFPTIQVTTLLPGAGPAVMAETVTTPLEHALGQISSLTEMSSTSAIGSSQITLTFELGRNIDAASQDVQSAITAASSLLPGALPAPPTFSKVNPADTPILVLALTAGSLPLRRITDLADTLILQKLSQVEGVGRVTVEGGQKEAIRINASAAALAGLGLSLEDVRAAIAAATLDSPKGTLDGPRQAFALTADDQLLSEDAYRDLVIAYRDGAPLRLGDIAGVVDGVENDQLQGRHNDSPAVIIEIQRQPGANIIATVDRVRDQLAVLEMALPAGVRITVVSDRTQAIRASLADLQRTLLVTAGCVVLVIFLFLRRLWATVIPSIALPLSLMATFGAMALFGFSLDNLSLMALTIATGFVVDDAIVMVENITRLLDRGASPVEAALAGARQISFTILSLTVSLIAVFVPIALMGGIIGRLFREFAITLCIAVAISAVVSLSLTPMLAGRLLRAKDLAARSVPPPASRGTAFGRFATAYEASLQVVLRHQPAVLALTLVTTAVAVWLYTVIPKGFIPEQDTGLLIGVIDAPSDISFQAMLERDAAVAKILAQDPEVSSVDSIIGAGPVNVTGNSARLFVTLRPWSERASTFSELTERLRRAAASVEGVTLFLRPAQDLQLETQQSRTRYQYTLRGADAVALRQWAAKLAQALAARPEFAAMASDQQGGGLELALHIDRDAAARLGVTIQAIDDTLYDAFGQRQVATVFTQLNQYHVVLQVDQAERSDPAVLGELHVKAASGMMVRLASLVSRTLRAAPLAVTHIAMFPAVTLSFDVAPGYSLGQCLAALRRTEAVLGRPAGVIGRLAGAADAFQFSLASEAVLIVAALVTVYIVLGVLYESVIHPLTILSTLPSAGVGALLALIFAGYDLSVMGVIGIMMLIGIVKKNAIIMIDFALDAERREGLAPERAIVQACRLRFRPIMMTTLAALFGALPLVFDSGAGSELRRPLGIAIVGGLIVSQTLTLYSTPVVYLALDHLRRFGPRPVTARDV